MKAKFLKTQSGQTLIETMVAVLMLATGISAALGLANFSFNASDRVVKQLIAMGLAREGIEGVKNMRDTNWLQSPLLATGCYDFTKSQAASAPCHTAWDSAFYNINPGVSTNLVVDYNVFSNDTQPYWTLANPGGYGLQFDPNGSTSGKFYTAENLAGSNYTYFRKITLTKDTTAPFNLDANMYRLRVISQVWFKGRGCPAVTDISYPYTSPCAVTLVSYLTNWKNY